MNTGIKHQALANSHQLKVVASAVCAMLLALIVPASAQQPAAGPRIGYLSGSSPSADAPRHHALRQGLRDLGYVEGSTIAIEWRFAEGK